MEKCHVKPSWKKSTMVAKNSNEKRKDVSQQAPSLQTVLEFRGGFVTGQSSDTRRLVVAISLSGSAVSFSLTVDEAEHTRLADGRLRGWYPAWTGCVRPVLAVLTESPGVVWVSDAFGAQSLQQHRGRLLLHQIHGHGVTLSTQHAQGV